MSHTPGDPKSIDMMSDKIECVFDFQYLGVPFFATAPRVKSGCNWLRNHQ